MRSLLLPFTAGSLALAALLPAQDQTPVVASSPRGLTARPTTQPVRIFLADVFRDPDLQELGGTQLRITTALGAINVELFDRTAPRTVQNFLRYVSASRYADAVWHRATQSTNPFVRTIDTGAYTLAAGAFAPIPAFTPLANEFGPSNVRGTVAMNRPTGSPDGATSAWFVNVGDNSALLDSFEGGFTVFGRVIEGGLATVDAIFALPRTNRGGDFVSLPVRNYTPPAAPTAANLVLVDALATGPKFSITGASSNPSVASIVSPAAADFSTTLNFGPMQGSAQITLTGRDFNGASVQTTFDVTVSDTPPATNLANLSTRARVGAGDDVLIAGFVVRDSPKRLLVRALGPSLTAFGVEGALPDPQFAITGNGGSTLGSNNDWRSSQQAEIQATGLAPTNDRDAALILTLPPGSYTPVVSGVGGATGVAIVEVYELAANEPQRLINLSSRGRVGVGSDVMIAGLVITGSTPKRVLIRAAGPSLTAFGVPGALADPQLEVFAGPLLLERNDDWRLAADGSVNPALGAIQASGFQPANDKESAVIATLAPGAYTAIVRGGNAGQGVAIIEVYDLD